MTVDMRKLKHLVTVAHTGSLSRAAEQLHLSQPAISRSISLMEDHLGVRLFNRSPQGVELSAAGKVAVEEAERLLNQARIFEHNWDQYKRGGSGHLRFGLWPLAGSIVLPSLLARITSTHPKLKLWASVNASKNLLEDLYNHNIEFLVCGEHHVSASPDLIFDHVGSLRFSIFVRNKHPLAKRRKISRSDLFDYPILSGVEPSQVPERFTGNAVIFCENCDVMRYTALETDSIWVVPPQMAAQELKSGLIKELKISDSPRQSIENSIVDVHIVRLKGYKLSPAAENATEYIKCFFHS